MAYKWTIDEVDAIEMPMLFALLGEIQAMPPHDFLANAEIRAAQQQFKREQRSALSGFAAQKGKVRRRNDGH